MSNEGDMMLRNPPYIPTKSRMFLLSDVMGITISRSELEKLYKAWILATVCKWIVSSKEYELSKKLWTAWQEEVLYIPPVVPYLLDDFYEDFWNAFIIVEGVDKVKATLEPPSFARIAIQGDEYSIPIHYLVAVIANRINIENLGDEEHIDVVKVKPILEEIQNAIRKYNINALKKAITFRKRGIIEDEEDMDDVEAEEEAKRLLETLSEQTCSIQETSASTQS